MERKQKALFSEKSADKEVINSLLNTLRIYNDMENFLVTEAGKLVKVNNFEVIALDEAEKLAEALQAKLTVVQNFIASEKAKAEAANGAADSSAENGAGDAQASDTQTNTDTSTATDTNAIQNDQAQATSGESSQQSSTDTASASVDQASSETASAEQAAPAGPENDPSIAEDSTAGASIEAAASGTDQGVAAPLS